MIMEFNADNYLKPVLGWMIDLEEKRSYRASFAPVPSEGDILLVGLHFFRVSHVVYACPSSTEDVYSFQVRVIIERITYPSLEHSILSDPSTIESDHKLGQMK